MVMDIATGLSKRVPPRSERTELDTCAPCHSRRAVITETPLPGEPFLDGYRPALLEDVLYHPDGQILDEVYVYGSFIQSKMYREGVTCQDCHDPHSLSVRVDGNAVCASCHLPEKFDTPQHHFHEADTEGAQCVACHMPAKNYMVVDARRDHSFRVPRPDLSDTLGTPNACVGCHQDQTNTWAAAKVNEWYGPERPPHFGEALYAGRSAGPGASGSLERLIANDEEPAIARATALDLLARYPSPNTPANIRNALSDTDALVRAGALRASQSLDPSLRLRLVFPLLDDASRVVRLEATRALASVPQNAMTPEQRMRLASAVDEYRSAQLVNADRPEAHLNLGAMHAERGEPDLAEASYQTALGLDPDFVQTYVNLADLYRALNRDADGETLLRQGLERNPQSAELLHALGLLRVRQRRLDVALDNLREAAELRADVPRYAYVYAVALQATGAVADAIEILETAHDQHPTDQEILFGLVSFHRDAGHIPSAVRYATILRELSPENPQWRQLVLTLESIAQRRKESR